LPAGIGVFARFFTKEATMPNDMIIPQDNSQEVPTRELLAAIPREDLIAVFTSQAQTYLDEAMRFRVGAVSAVKIYCNQLSSISPQQKIQNLQTLVNNLARVYRITSPSVVVTDGECGFDPACNSIFVDEDMTLMPTLRSICCAIYGSNDPLYCQKWALNLFRKGFQGRF
jgi:hypothetical protein